MNFWPDYTLYIMDYSPLHHLKEVQWQGEQEMVKYPSGLCCLIDGLSLRLKFNDKEVVLIELSANEYPCKVSGHAMPVGKVAKTEAELLGEIAKLMAHQKTKYAVSGLFK